MAKRKWTVIPVPKQIPSQSDRKVKNIETKIASIERIPGSIREIKMTFTNGNSYTLKEDNVRITWMGFREMWKHAEVDSKVSLWVTNGLKIESVTYCYE